MLAWWVHDWSPYALDLGGGWGLRWYGLSYLAAFVAGWLLYRHLAARGYSCLRPEQAGDFIFGGAVFGVLLGGRLGYMLLYNLDGFLADPLSFFRVWEGGMSAHGGIAGLALYSLWYARRYRLPWLNLGDNLVVVAPIGLFLGRLANFINGELYGRVARVPWAVIFPKSLHDAPAEIFWQVVERAQAVQPSLRSVEAVAEAARHSPELREILRATLEPRHPSQLYEAALEGAALLAVLWLLRTRCHLREGVLTGVFFIGYAALRSFCEIYREPDAPLVGALTRGQFYSIFLVMAGVGFLAASRDRRRWPREQKIPEK